MLPSTLVMMMFQHYRVEFERRLVAQTARLREFWSDFLQRPRSAAWAALHPYLRGKTAGDLVCSIPVALHTDAGPCTKRQSMNVVSWSSLLWGGEEKLTKYPIRTYLKTDSRGDNPSWVRIIEDFEALATGYLHGRPIAQDGRKTWRLILLVCKCDEEAKVQEFGMPSYSNPAACCIDCRCDDTGRPWTDLSRGAAWRPTEHFTAADWKSRFRLPLHPLVASPFACERWFFSRADAFG